MKNLQTLWKFIEKKSNPNSMSKRKKHRYECTLSDELLSKAVEDLNEPADNSVRLEQIDSLRAAFKMRNPNVKLFRKDDMFFLQFLRASKFEQTKALQLLTSYHQQTNEWLDAFNLINDPELMGPVLNKGLAFPVGGRTKGGSGIAVLRHGKGGASLLDGFTTFILVLELMLEKEENQIFGIMVIQDFSFITPKTMWQFEPQLIKKIYNFLFNGLPGTLVKTLIVNQPVIFTSINLVIHRLLSEREKQKKVFIGTNYRLINEYVDLSILPPSVGGTGPDCDAEFWKRKILTSSKRYLR